MHSSHLKKILPAIIEDLMKVPMNKGEAKIEIHAGKLGHVDPKGMAEMDESPEEEKLESPHEEELEDMLSKDGQNMSDYEDKKKAEPSLMDRFKRSKKHSFLA